MNTYDVTVSEYKVNGRVRLLKLAFEDSVEFNFTAGQFIMVNYHDEKGNFKRSYSISSDPEHKNHIELCICLKEGGRGSGQVGKIKKGDKLSINGPFGVFALKDNPGNDVIFVAGGTGIAPLRSMLKHLLNTKFPNKVYLFYSFRCSKDYLYKEEFDTLEKENPNFKLVLTATRPGPDWKGETKYVQDIFQKYVSEHDNKDVYSCGPVVMVDAVFDFLKNVGFKPEQLHRERWS